MNVKRVSSDVCSDSWFHKVSSIPELNSGWIDETSN